MLSQQLLCAPWCSAAGPAHLITLMLEDFHLLLACPCHALARCFLCQRPTLEDSANRKPQDLLWQLGQTHPRAREAGEKSCVQRLPAPPSSAVPCHPSAPEQHSSCCLARRWPSAPHGWEQNPPPWFTDTSLALVVSLQVTNLNLQPRQSPVACPHNPLILATTCHPPTATRASTGWGRGEEFRCL